MICYERTVENVLVLNLKGKLLTSDDTDVLYNHLNTVVERKIKHLIIDLRNVTMMSSLGIGSLMKAMITIREVDGDLRLTGLSEKVKDLFSITKLIGVMKIFDNVNEAVKSFKD